MSDEQQKALQDLADIGQEIERDIAPDGMKEMAASLGCFLEEDVAALSKTKMSTVDAWRKRGIGPPYVRFGNRFLYPKNELAAFLLRRINDRLASDRNPLHEARNDH